MIGHLCLFDFITKLMSILLVTLLFSELVNGHRRGSIVIPEGKSGSG